MKTFLSDIEIALCWHTLTAGAGIPKAEWDLQISTQALFRPFIIETDTGFEVNKGGAPELSADQLGHLQSCMERVETCPAALVKSMRGWEKRLPILVSASAEGKKTAGKPRTKRKPAKKRGKLGAAIPLPGRAKKKKRKGKAARK